MGLFSRLPPDSSIHFINEVTFKNVDSAHFPAFGKNKNRPGEPGRGAPGGEPRRDLAAEDYGFWNVMFSLTNSVSFVVGMRFVTVVYPAAGIPSTLLTRSTPLVAQDGLSRSPVA